MAGGEEEFEAGFAVLDNIRLLGDSHGKPTAE
ncbi:hypothetical protein PMI37_02560 [Pseudomonas sp. GM80]|nr:hypothetical protein PMI37_02560 [Pseudomonas sp. GM80]